jgi:cbb3-type cytochrome oxidase subunit 3
MIREALSHLHWSVLPVVSMMMFLAVFVGVLFVAYRKESGRIYETMSRLPVEGQEEGSLK